MDLEDQLKHYRALINHVRDGIHVLDIRGDIVEVNDAFCEMMGYSREEAVKLNISDWNSQYSKEELLEILANLVGKNARFETLHRRKDGTLINVEINTKGIDISGQVYFFASSRDISERKKQEHLLASSESYLRSIFNAMPDATVISDAQGIITMANSEIESVLGYKPDELVGQPVEVLVPQPFLALHPALRTGYAASPTTRPMGTGRLVRALKKDGSEIEVEISLSPIHTHQGLFFASSLRDITERKQLERGLRLAQHSVEHAQDAIFRLNQDARILYVNKAACKYLGYSREELLKLSIFDINPDFTREIWDTHWHMVLKSGSRRLETRHKRRDGKLVPVEVVANCMELEGELIFTSFVRNISERKEIEEKLRINQFATDHAPDNIIWIDRDAHIVYANEAACREYGYTRKQMLAKLITDIDPGADIARWQDHWLKLQHAGNLVFETTHRHRNGSIIPVEVSANFVKFENTELNVSFSRNITERKREEEAMHNLAFHDPLTGLPNRRLLLDRLGLALSVTARSRDYGALLFIDMDKFKALNDTLGHDYGDLLLVEAAGRLKSCVRGVDTVARFAGDEFVVLLQGNGVKIEDASQNVAHVAERIRASLATPYQLKEHSYEASSSTGVCLFSGDQISIDELIKCADTAMYQAKRAGRNTVQFFNATMQQSDGS